MNGGDSNIATLIYHAEWRLRRGAATAGFRWRDAEYFSFDGNHYLATASIRTGPVPMI